jgi:hypothetical protein
MLLHIANYFDADRRSAIAGNDLSMGAVCKVTADSNNERVLNAVTVTGDLANIGAYGVAFKVSSDPLQVDTSTVPTAFLGDRTVSIKSGDRIVEVRRGAILEYAPSILDASLDPARSGALPVAGATLAVKPTTGLPCSVGAGSAITTPVVLRCYNVVNGKVRIELL